LGLFLKGVKRQWYEADHSPPSSGKVKNGVTYLLPPIPFMAWCLIKPRDIFTFTIYLSNPKYVITIYKSVFALI
jgi:hypothetical protein